MYTTRKNLLKRLQKCDDISWNEFYLTYWPLVLAIGQKLGMSQDDCKDLMQEIMLDLFKGEALLRYDASRGKFRTFFGVLVRHKALAMLQASARFSTLSSHAGPDSDETPKPAVAKLIQNSQDDNEPFQKIFDEEYNKYLISLALNELRARINPETYDIFEMVVLQGRPPKEVAQYLGLNRNIIDKYCSRCRKSLQRIISEIRAENPEFNPDLSI
jgi:RNA polymerase sigma-70 factor (ECF subfamily)